MMDRRFLMPIEAEGAEIREEAQRRVGQVVRNLLDNRPSVLSLFAVIEMLVHGDLSNCTHLIVVIQLVPNSIVSDITFRPFPTFFNL